MLEDKGDIMLYMENARTAFAEACGTWNKYNSESEFYHKLAQMIPNRVDVDTLILAIKIALADADREDKNTLGFIAIIPQYVRQCASYEFTHEFREKFNLEVLGFTQEDLPDVDYGCIEVEKDVIDISNKDRYEVLAALYNASTPVGKGFIEYNPMSWDRETAAMYYECYGKANAINGTVNFKWILGRPVSCTFEDNLVYVSSYNRDNEEGLAQRAISTVPNIEDVKHNIK